MRDCIIATKSKSPVQASAKTLRAFYQANPKVAAEVADAAGVSTNSVLGADGDASRVRGRVNPAFTADFAERGLGVYAEVPQGGIASGIKEVTIERTSPKTGRAIKPTVMPLTEARVLAGHAANRKGGLSSADRLKVAEALTAQGK